MQAGRFNRRRLLVGAFTAIAWGVMTQLAAGHGINVFAYVEDGQIRGQVFARGGDPIVGAKVTAFDPSGEEGATATTDEKGEFSLAPSRRCDWRLVATAGEGHQAEYTVPADQFSEDMPSRPAQQARPVEAATGSQGTAAEPEPEPLVHSEGDDGLAEVGRQLIALRRDLDQLRRELRWQDLVGGVGYILGIMGLVFYFLGARRRERNAGQVRD